MTCKECKGTRRVERVIDGDVITCICPKCCNDDDKSIALVWVIVIAALLLAGYLGYTLCGVIR